MQDISLHLLDIIENSVRAKAKNIKIRIIRDVQDNILLIAEVRIMAKQIKKGPETEQH